MSKSKTTQSRAHEEKLLRQEAFLEAYERLCHISQAAETAGIERKLHYYWLRTDADYKARFEESDRIAIKALEDEAHRRALHGVQEPVFHQGQICGHVQKFSDRLMEFLLRGRQPEIYGDRFKAEMTGKNGAPIEHNVEHVVRFGKPD